MFISEEAKEIAATAIQLNNDVNGNPRYLVWKLAFDGQRPPFADKYRGKKFGAGWVFQSYYLAHDIQLSLNKMREDRQDKT